MREIIKKGIYSIMAIIWLVSVCMLDSESSIFFWICLIDGISLLVVAMAEKKRSKNNENY